MPGGFPGAAPPGRFPAAVAGDVRILGSEADAGVGSAEAFGADGKLTLRLSAVAGIASGEAFGAGGKETLRLSMPAGMASAEAFGATAKEILRVIGGAGIGSGEAFGANGEIYEPSEPPPPPIFLGMLAGIVSGEAFGADGNLDSGEAEIPPAPYVTAGAPSVMPWPPRAPGELTVLTMMAGIASAEAFGANGILAQLPAPAAAAPRSPADLILVSVVSLPITPAPRSIHLSGVRGIPSAERFGRGRITHRPPPWLFN